MSKTSQLSFRDAKVGDELILARIQTESWRSAFHEILSPEDLIRYTDVAQAEAMYRHVLSKQLARIVIASIGKTPHAIAAWGQNRDNMDKTIAELICIHSMPDNRRKGFGSALMKHVLTEMKTSGYTQVMLWVFAQNIPARRFYEAHGFVLTDRTQTSYGAQEVCYIKVL